jgi:hypothetical protein
VKESSIRLPRHYGCINWASTLEQNGHKELRNQLKNVKKSFKAEMDDAYQKDYFYQVHNVMMEKQPRSSCRDTWIGRSARMQKIPSLLLSTSCKSGCGYGNSSALEDTCCRRHDLARLALQGFEKVLGTDNYMTYVPALLNR